MQKYIAKSSSLNSYRLSSNPQAFSRILGEGGPREAVNEGWRSLHSIQDKEQNKNLGY